MRGLLLGVLALTAAVAGAWPKGTPQPNKYELPPASPEVVREAKEIRKTLGDVDLKEHLIGHRGDCTEVPENTVPAFKAAVDAGFSFEADLWLTRDGEVVVTHDVYLFREGVRTKGWVTNAVWKGDLELSDAGIWKDRKWKGTKFPTVDDVLAFARDGRFIVLHVCDSRCREILPKIAEAVRRHSNVNPSNVILQADADIVQEYLPGYRGVVPLLPRKGWMVDDPPIDLYGWTDRVRLATRPFLMIRWDEELMTKRYVDFAHAKGFKVIAWTVNDAASAWAAIGRGVDWVLTDRPSALLEGMNRWDGTR